jgi:hypothetical protein
MPTVQELSDLTSYIVSDDIDKGEFLLYYNFCMGDLSEVIKYEKNMTEFPIDGNDNETNLPSDLFQIVSVVVEHSSGLKEVAFEVGVNDNVSLNDSSFINQLIDKRSNVYSRWDGKLYIKSEYLTETSGSTTLTINVKYYGSLPTLDYTDTDLDLDQLPPIVEQHYHYIIAHYIAYMYYLNGNDKTEADSQLQIYLTKKMEIKDYINKHRSSSNKNRSIGLVRRT